MTEKSNDVTLDIYGNETDMTLPQVISPEDVPLTHYIRPERGGVKERFEPGDGFLRNLITADTARCTLFEALPGESFWTDDHAWHEILYVIEGEVTILVPPLGKAIVAKEGQLIHNLPRTKHQTMNRSSKPMKVLVFSPQGQDGAAQEVL